MLTGKKILFADDDEAFLAMYSRLMEKNEMKVFVAHDGEEALKVADAEHPDIIILDIGMPKKDGLQTTQEMRKFDWAKKTPIIILTGKQPELDKVAEASPTYYFLKGNKSFEEFISTVQDLLRD